MRRAGLAVLVVLGLARAASGQELATLLADELRIEADTAIVAEGEVEVYYGETTLSASRLRYDRTTDRLTIDGPLVLREGDGAVVVAEAAELDADLRDGTLRAARLVLDRQLQLAANAITRVDGRYTALTKTVASSCRVCADNPTPVWEIRATRVIHDDVDRQIYFDNARIRALGVPIFYVPRLRLPDPTNTRATGVLLPSVRQSSNLGTGVRLPYFVRLSERADLTLTPYVSPQTRTLAARWRHVTGTGQLTFAGAVSADTLEDGPRAYLFGQGIFALPRDFVLRFDVELVSDPDYLLQYGYSGKDRLDSEVSLARVDRESAFRAAVTDFQTLRDAEIPIADTLPSGLASTRYERRLRGRPLGGSLWAGIGADALARPSDLPGPGRDVARLGGDFTWRRDAILGPGLRLDLEGRVDADAYRIVDDPAYADSVLRVVPAAAVTLRWPLLRAGADGVRRLLTPSAQLAWSETGNARVPNEDSRVTEFDAGNLMALSRFPGEDRIEDGTRAALGLTYTRTGPGGWALTATGGRILRAEDETEFPPNSGLSGPRSDWLAGAFLTAGANLSLGARAQFDPDLGLRRGEGRIDWQGDRLAVDSTALYARPEPTEGRDARLAEWSLAADYRFASNWTAGASYRYDLNADRAARAALALEYRNECITVDLALTRRFVSSTNVRPTTDIGLSVSLAGVAGESAPERPGAACRG